MKTIISTFLPAVAVAAIPLGLLASTASAATIYSDNFPGLSTSPLNGTTPATDTPNVNWAADSQWKANGSISLSSGSYADAYLTLTPASGQIYTLSADINAIANASGYTNSWIGFGFLSTGIANPTPFYANAAPFILDYVPNSGTEISTWAGPGLSIPGNAYNYANSGTQDMQMVLNTGGAKWTVQFYDGGSPLGSQYSYTTNPSIVALGFGTSNASGQVSYFSLTDVAVPEPATLGLVAVGGLGLLLIGRKHAARRSV